MNFPQGIIVPVVTPLRGNLLSVSAFDAAGFTRLVTTLRDAGVESIFALGLTGEAYQLDDNVLDSVAHHAAYTTRGTVRRTMVGITRKDPWQTNLAARAMEGRAVVLQPSRIPYSDLGTLLMDVHDETGAGIFLYENPATVRTRIVSPHDVEALGAPSYLRGMNISADAETFLRYRDALPDLPLYVGDANALFDIAARMGTLPAGVVTGPGNVYPQEWVDAWKALESGEDTARFQAFFEAFRTVYTTMPGGKDTIGAIKEMLYLQGIIDSPAKAGGKILSAADRTHIREGYERLEQMRADL